MSGGLVRAVGLLCLLTSNRMSWGQEDVTFDFDEPPETEHRITDNLSYGIEIELDGFHPDELDLDSGRDNDQSVLEPILDVAFTFQPNEILRAFVNLELSRKEVIGSSDDGESNQISLGFVETYVTLREFLDGLTVQIGRQQFQDPLEWYYDQELDAVRAYYRVASVTFEASLSEQGFVDEDLLNSDDTDKVTNAFLVGHHAFDEDAGLSGYLLHRNGRERESEDLTFFGIQSAGDLTEDVAYWLNAAYVMGDETSGDGSRNVHGYGVDLIVTFAPELVWEPSVTAGFAFGSGDDDPEDGVDRSFRQTGLQENSAEFNGVAPFKYYGEVFDPELGNLAVLTLGGGLKPSDSSSLDLVYHYYWQADASAELRDSNLEAVPDGQHRELGHEVDLVLGYLGIEDLSAVMVLGAFFPGQAFGDDADNAYLLRFELQYEF